MYNFLNTGIYNDNNSGQGDCSNPRILCNILLYKKTNKNKQRNNETNKKRDVIKNICQIVYMSAK